MLFMSSTNLGLALGFPASAEINVVPLNTLRVLHTGVVRIVSFMTRYVSAVHVPTAKSSSSKSNGSRWVTLKTTRFRWEAELMQQMLLAHDLSARLIDLGIEPYMGQGSAAALQVHLEDEQVAILLLSALEGEAEAFK